MGPSAIAGHRMQIPPPATRVTVPNPQPAALAWQSGQRLEAVVTRGAAPGGAAEVQIGGRRLALNLPTAVSAGGRLQLEVVRAGAEPLLRMLSLAPAAPGARAAAGASGAGAPPPALASLLPMQGSQAPLLSALSALARNPAVAGALPRDLQATVLQAIGTIPSLAQVLQPGTLKQAIRSSGLFYEANLARMADGVRPTAWPEGDLKAALLALASRVRAGTEVPVPSPFTRGRDTALPRAGSGPIAQRRIAAEFSGGSPASVAEGLRAAAEQALARLVLHQWSTVEDAESGQTRWLLELPVRSGDGTDIVHLLLERERRRESPEVEPAWRVELALDLPELGPVHIRITVSGDQVSTQIWAGEADTFARVDAALPELRTAMEGRRLRVRDLGSHHGAPPDNKGPSVQPRPILDDRA